MSSKQSHDYFTSLKNNLDGVTIKYYMVGDKVTFEDNGIDRIHYTYDVNSKLVSMNLNGTEYYYIYNGQGDVTGLFDSTGTKAVTYTYDIWGRLEPGWGISGTLASTVGVKNPYRYRGYRYRGYRYDTETGLIICRVGIITLSGEGLLMLMQ